MEVRHLLHSDLQIATEVRSLLYAKLADALPAHRFIEV
jgi:hypothetical protein